MKFTRALLVAAALAAFACTPSPRDGATSGQQMSPTPDGSPADQAGKARPTTRDEAGELKADFEGTAGIISKRYEVREAALLVDVRTGRHDGFDRIVFEFKGTELPGYYIEYIDKPVRSCGSGEVVPLAGNGWLQIRFEPANAHTEEGKPTLNFRELVPKLPVVLELRSTCDFEAHVEWVAGVTSPNRYRVLELSSPTRLVVDVKHGR